MATADNWKRIDTDAPRTPDWRTQVGGKVSTPEEVETSLQGSSTPIDFLLIDAEHPVDSDRALHAAARAREIRPGIGVLLTSTHANGDTLKRSLAERD